MLPSTSLLVGLHILATVGGLQLTVGLSVPLLVTRDGGAPRVTLESELTALELRLRSEIGPGQGQPRAMLGLMQAWTGIYDASSQNSVAAIVAVQFDNHIELRRYLADDHMRYYVTSLSRSEFKAFRSRLRSLFPWDLTGTPDRIPGPEEYLISGGPHQRGVFVLNMQGGMRVLYDQSVMGYVATQREIARYQALDHLFVTLMRNAPTMVAKYTLPHPIPGFRVLFGSPGENVVRAWVVDGNVMAEVRDRVIGAPWRTSSNPSRVVQIEAGRLLSTRKPNDPPDHVADFVMKMGRRIVLPRVSNDRRWVVGVDDSGGSLVCYDERRSAFIDLAPSVRFGNWVPLYYSGVYHCFVLGRLSSRRMDSHSWQSLIQNNDETEIRLFSPTVKEQGDIVASQSSIDTDSFKANQRAFGPLWFQHLPTQLQCSPGKSRNVWLTNFGGRGTSVLEFDIRKWEPTGRRVYIPGFAFQTDCVYLDFSGKRMLVAYEGDLLCFPFQPGLFGDN